MVRASWIVPLTAMALALSSPARVLAASGSQAMAMCPMQVPGTAVTTADLPGGVSLSFTTGEKDQVATLRQRVAQMAAMHNAGRCPMMGGPGQGQSGAQGAGAAVPRATATVEQIPGGARMVLRPGTPDQLEALRAQVRACAKRMTEGGCPMRGGPNGP